MQQFLFFDLAILLLSIICGIVVANRGFFAHLGSVAGYGLGLVLALLISPAFLFISESHLTAYFNPLLLSLLIFVLLFIILFLLFKVIGEKFSNILKGHKAEAFDKILGFFLGFLEAIIVLAVIFTLIKEPAGLLKYDWFGKSYSYKYLFSPLIDFFLFQGQNIL